MGKAIQKAVIRKQVGVQPRTPDELLDAFLTALDPRGESEHSHAVQFALACSPDPRFPEFLERLYQPRYRRWSLGAIARSCDLTLGEFVSFWRNAQVERAIATFCRASPAVAYAIVSNALGREVLCDRCDGLGWVEIVGIAARLPPELIRGYLGKLRGHPMARRTCPKCDGSGKMREPGNPHACDKVLEIAGLIGKNRAGVQIAQNFSRASHAHAVAKLSSMTIDVSAEVVDGE